MSRRPSPFIMKDTQACATALRYWLKEQDFNGFSFGAKPNTLKLVVESNPGSDYSKLKSIVAHIQCSDDAAFEQAERIIRSHLGWR